MGADGIHPVTITVGEQDRGQPVPADFAGLSFERGPLNPGNAGVAGYLFSPRNTSLVSLVKGLGLRSLRIGGGSVDQFIPAGTGGDGLAGIDSLFAFAQVAGVRIIYTLRLLNPAGRPAGDLDGAHALVAGYIWRNYREQLASFAVGNEPDWHAFHDYPGHPMDPAISEEVPGVPGSAYRSFLAAWRRLAGTVTAAAPGALLSGPDTGAYDTTTFTPDPRAGISWTQCFGQDEAGSGRLAEVTQHYYIGGSPGRTRAKHAIANMLSPEWASAAAPGHQPRGTTYIPYPSFYETHVAPASACGLPCRLTECNDYLVGVPGASNAFASALWALDCLHWWAAHGASGVNFHNKQWLWTDTIVPGRAPGRYAATPKGHAIRAFALGSAGRVTPARIGNPGGVNLTAYCVSGQEADYVTVINKTYGEHAADAQVTIVPRAPGAPGAQVMTLEAAVPPRARRAALWPARGASARPGDVTAAGATLGGAAITGDSPWQGTWADLPAGQGGGVRLTVSAATAAIVRMPRAPGQMADSGARR
jgi:hypothetical protein